MCHWQPVVQRHAELVEAWREKTNSYSPYSPFDKLRVTRKRQGVNFHHAALIVQYHTAPVAQCHAGWLSSRIGGTSSLKMASCTKTVRILAASKKDVKEFNNYS